MPDGARQQLARTPARGEWRGGSLGSHYYILIYLHIIGIAIIEYNMAREANRLYPVALRL